MRFKNKPTHLCLLNMTYGCNQISRQDLSGQASQASQASQDATSTPAIKTASALSSHHSSARILPLCYTNAHTMDTQDLINDRAVTQSLLLGMSETNSGVSLYLTIVRYLTIIKHLNLRKPSLLDSWLLRAVDGDIAEFFVRIIIVAFTASKEEGRLVSGLRGSGAG